MKRDQAKIDKIMSNAYEEAFKVLQNRVLGFMKSNGDFVEYVHAVGWGPAFYRADGSCVQYAHDMPSATGRAVFEFCNTFYDTYGAGNERVHV